MFQQLKNRFAGALEPNRRKKNENPTSKLEIIPQSPLSPIFYSNDIFFLKLKKGKKG
jgi:hypothetical protein